VASGASASVWLFGPKRDLLLGCGGGYILLFGLFLAFGPEIRGHLPPAIAPMLILLVSTPHYGATLLRVYERRSERRAYALFSLWATLALLAAFVVGVQEPAVGTVLFTLYLTWSPWHYTGQNYGIAMMFLNRSGVRVTPLLRRWMHASFVLSYVLTFVTMHRAAADARGLHDEVVHLGRLGIPAYAADVAIPLLAAAYITALLQSARLALVQARPRTLLPVALIALSQSLWFSLPDMARTFASGVEPLEFDHRAFYFNWVVLAHAVQYLWLTAYYARSFPEWNGAGRYLAKTLLAGNVAWLLPALVLAPQLLGGSASEVNVALLVAALVNLHHFILDGAIWKLRHMPVANVLVRSGDAREPVPEDDSRRGISRTLFWATATPLFAIALAEFGLRQIAIPERVRDGNPRASVVLLDRLSWIGRDSALLRLSLGHELARQGHSEAARDAYRRSASLTPSANAYSALACVFRSIVNT
jgi:hypothetical protein